MTNSNVNFKYKYKFRCVTVRSVFMEILYFQVFVLIQRKIIIKFIIIYFLHLHKIPLILLKSKKQTCTHNINKLVKNISSDGKQ